MKSFREFGTSTYNNPNLIDVATQTAMDVQHISSQFEVNHITIKKDYQCTPISNWNIPNGRACGIRTKKRNMITQTHVEESGDQTNNQIWKLYIINEKQLKQTKADNRSRWDSMIADSNIHIEKRIIDLTKEIEEMNKKIVCYQLPRKRINEDRIEENNITKKLKKTLEDEIIETELLFGEKEIDFEPTFINKLLEDQPDDDQYDLDFIDDLFAGSIR